jgi:hypothetical protein
MNSKEIPDFPEYIIYEDGRVYSKPRKGSRGGYLKVIYDSKDKDAYPAYTLRRPGVKKRGKIHQLLAAAFIPNPDNKPLVLHRDDNRLNYSLDNLYWGDWGDNNRDAKKNGRRYC